jgi:hypothetical protein
LIELISRLLRSVWERPVNDVFLIGPQHFDLGIQEVRDKLTEISGMRDVIAKDLWDGNDSAHAQVIDLQSGKDAAAQVGSLLLTASLSTAVNAVKGLTREEMVECLVSPLREPSEFLSAFEELEKTAWYLHHTSEGRYYFDRQENLTKLLQSLAHDAPEPQVEDLIRHRLTAMFKPIRKTAYADVLPLPRIEDVADRVRKGRILLIVSPDAKIPPEEVQRFFADLSQKNNLCVLTGDKTAMGSVETAARQLYAAHKADGRIPQGHPQRDDLERKQQTYEQDFNATILNLFDKVLFPIQRAGRAAQLVPKPLDMTRDTTQPFDGEAQIEKTLTSHPLKLYLDVEKDFDPICDKAQDLLWPENQDDARWADIADRYAEQAGMPWLPPKGLDMLKSIACISNYFTVKPSGILPESAPVDWSKPEYEGVKVAWREDLSETEHHRLEVQMLPKAPYREWVEAAKRPEEVMDTVHDHIWDAVNTHLGTSAYSFPELVEQLGIMRFGHRPRVGDTFCGSGQIPFEAARLGCDVYASLNPVACMLTWGAFNIVGAPSESREELSCAQKELIAKVQAEVDALEGETDAHGWRGRAYLYCIEARCPSTQWRVPLLSSRIVSIDAAAIQVRTLTGLNQEAKGLYRDENVFEDADLQMAGYAAALRVLTRYAIIDGHDMTVEAIRPRVKGETTFVDSLIAFAVDTANQCLVPEGIAKTYWDGLTGAERFYLKLIDLEAKGLKTLDNYQNFAKAFKVRDFRALMAYQRANQARLKSAVEFGKTEMSDSSELHQSVLRAVLYAMMELVKDVDSSEVLALAHLTLNVPDYYANQTQRDLVIELADYLAKKLDTLRPEEASAARVLRELVKNQRLG